MTNSILDSVKKVVGIDPSYTVFDEDIKMHINTVFSDLFQLGVGPDTPFSIEDKEALWEQFLSGNVAINSVKTYVCLRVRLLFDPPTTSFAIAAMEKQVKEFEWRLNVQREEAKYPWVGPSLTS